MDRSLVFVAVVLLSAAAVGGLWTFSGPAVLDATDPKGAESPERSPAGVGASSGERTPAGPTGPRLAFAEASARVGLEYSSVRTDEDDLGGNAGAYVTDYDRDGWPDVLAMGGEAPVMFENVGGEFSRADVLPPVDGYVKAGHFLDYDADGDDDLLYLLKSHPPILLENTGGAFERTEAGLSNVSLSVPAGASSADYDRDGCLDLFIIQNGNWDTDIPGSAENRDAVLDGSARPIVTDGGRNLLFRGTCGGFENVTTSAGIEGRAWTWATSFVDVNGDGWPDIHVADDFSHDVLYVNQHDGTFRRVDVGPATDRNAMSSEVADVNDDGRPDIFVTNIYFEEWMSLRGSTDLTKPDLAWIPEGNNLLVNLPGDDFDDRATRYRVAKGGWGWAASIADFDNDGHLDVFHTTSADVPIVEYDLLGYNHPQVWAGTGDGFEKRKAADIGLAETNGRGIARLDYDRDGDLDLLVATSPDWLDPTSPSAFRLYENVGAGSRSLSIRIERDGVTSIGARVYVTTDESTRFRVLNSKSDFLSQEPRALHVGLGNGSVERIRVIWPDGTERTFTEFPDARFLRISPDGIGPVDPDE